MDKCRLRGASVEHKLTDSEMGGLHKNHINTFVQIDNNLYLPYGGCETSDGTSFRLAREYGFKEMPGGVKNMV